MAIIQASRMQITAAEARAAWDYDVEHGEFKASINIGGVASKTLGRFNTAEEAHQVYLNAKRIHHAGCTL